MNDIIDQARRFWVAAGGTAVAHYRAAEVAARWHKYIGIPNVILAALVATSVFATLQQTTANPVAAIATGVIAVVAAILAALQAFLNLSDKAEKHKSAGGRYAALRNRIELFRLQFENPDQVKRDTAIEELSIFAADLDSLDAESPSLSKAMFRKGSRDFQQHHWPKTEDQA